MQLVLTNVRLSYPHLFTAKAAEGSTKAKFSAAFVLDKKGDRAQIATIEDAIETMLKENKLKVDPDKRCLKDGSLKPEAYGDEVMFLNASNDIRPQVVDRKRNPLAEEDDVVYAGCYVNAVVRLWAQNNAFGRRINASLEAVQFVADGERLGRRPVEVDKTLPDLDGDADPLG